MSVTQTHSVYLYHSVNMMKILALRHQFDNARHPTLCYKENALWTLRVENVTQAFLDVMADRARFWITPE